MKLESACVEEVTKSSNPKWKTIKEKVDYQKSRNEKVADTNLEDQVKETLRSVVVVPQHNTAELLTKDSHQAEKKGASNDSRKRGAEYQAQGFTIKKAKESTQRNKEQGPGRCPYFLSVLLSKISVERQAY